MMVERPDGEPTGNAIGDRSRATHPYDTPPTPVSAVERHESGPRSGCPEPRARVEVSGASPKPEVEPGAGHRHGAPRLHAGSLVYERSCDHAVGGPQSVCVLDHHVGNTGDTAGERHSASRNCPHGSARCGGELDSTMTGAVLAGWGSERLDEGAIDGR